MSQNGDRPAFLDKAVLIEVGNTHHDFEEGQVFEHHWGRTLTEADNMAFNTLTLHYNPMYFNTEYSKEHGHDRMVVNPLLVFNTVLGMSVEDLSECIGGPFLGINKCTYHAPFYVGDTITCKSKVIGKRETKKPGMGVVTWYTEGYNQHGELILDYERSNLSVYGDTILEL